MGDFEFEMPKQYSRTWVDGSCFTDFYMKVNRRGSSARLPPRETVVHERYHPYTLRQN